MENRYDKIELTPCDKYGEHDPEGEGITIRCHKGASVWVTSLAPDEAMDLRDQLTARLGDRAPVSDNRIEERQYVLRLSDTSSTLCRGRSGEHAAQRYRNAHPWGLEVVAWDYPEGGD